MQLRFLLTKNLSFWYPATQGKDSTILPPAAGYLYLFGKSKEKLQCAVNHRNLKINRTDLVVGSEICVKRRNRKMIYCISV